MNHILDGNENEMTTDEKAKVLKKTYGNYISENRLHNQFLTTYILDILFGHDDLIFFTFYL